MPYRNNGGPEDYYDQSSAFNPYTGRLNGGQLVMQFLQRMQAEKDRKKQAGWDVEDREMNKRVKEAQIRNLDETRSVRDYETPEQRAARENANKLQEHKFRLEEIDRTNAFKEKVAAAKDAEDETKTAAAELRRIGLASKIERAQRQKKHKEIRTQIEAIDKRLLALTKQYSSAKSGGDALLENSTKAEIDRVTTQKELLDAEMYNLSADVIGGQGESTAPKASGKDKFGYTIGEERAFPDGKYKYIGDNKWQQVK